MTLRPVDDYRREAVAAARRTGPETVDLGGAVGRFLFTDIEAPHDVPSFSNSAMDGYAVVGVDVSEAGAELDVVGEVAAGESSDRELKPGEAMKIMTGAPMPPGADTVVRVEDTTDLDGQVRIEVAVETGKAVRYPGSDVQVGERLFEAGTRLGEAHIGVLATVGVANVEVARRPKVAVLSTGDELVAAGVAELAPGRIRDSNRPMLLALVEAAGAEAVDFGRVPDDEDVLRSVLGQAAATCQMIVTSGGVSMGEYDVVKSLLTKAGVDFFGVAMKPGKPQGYGVLGGAQFFGLPGNPVSVFVSFEQFVRPAILAAQGACKLLRPRLSAIAGEPLHSDPAKEEFIRARLSFEPEPVVHVNRGQGSHVLSGLALADVFAVSPVGTENIEVGSRVEIELFTAAPTRTLEDD